VILDDFKTALDHMRTHWMHKKNGELFITPIPTPTASPRAHRARRDIRDVESTGSPYSCCVSPSKKPHGSTVHLDHIHIQKEVRVQSEILDDHSREEITISEEIPDIPLRKP
jgi:hypothetical protein